MARTQWGATRRRSPYRYAPQYFDEHSRKEDLVKNVFGMGVKLGAWNEKMGPSVLSYLNRLRKDVLDEALSAGVGHHVFHNWMAKNGGVGVTIPLF